MERAVRQLQPAHFDEFGRRPGHHHLAQAAAGADLGGADGERCDAAHGAGAQQRLRVVNGQVARGRGHRVAGVEAAFKQTMDKMGTYSIVALLLTLVLLFAFQGKAIVAQPLIIAMLAVPILIQVFFNSGLAYWLNRAVGEKHNVACPSALIGASNFFELAVAAAISLFGFQSGAALATVVGVLVEVPVMLLVVRWVNRSKNWYERGVN